MDSLAFLENAEREKLHAVYVLYGDESFLKRRVVDALRRRVFGAEGDDLGLSTYAGDKLSFATVHDELHTLPFLASRRLVVVENADPFVTAHRQALEEYVAEPAPHGILVLDVKAWPSTTRLARAIPAKATLSCKAPAAAKLPEWCVHWTQTVHGKQLAAPAARLLVDLVGAEMGLLDQELAKLAVYAGSSPRIEAKDVDRLVGSSRAENAFKIFDAIAGGRAAEAMSILDQLFDRGEEPMRLLGAFSYQLRRLARAARLCQQGLPLGRALEEAGFPPYARQSGEQQLRHLGPRRTDRLYDWLLETDLGLKGSSQLPPRTLLERLVVRLAQKRDDVPAGKVGQSR
ncbi:MAG TPA: DNA polymerase III subunit delta [Gemmataceae bacterium]|nr:DNA polymerase III subunit delta [Gemmataceae bacterium]